MCPHWKVSLPFLLILAAAVLGPSLASGAGGGEQPGTIDRATLDAWSAPYRGWHYWPEPIIPAEPKVPGFEGFKNTDVPTVYQLPGQPDKWLMSFIAFNGQGYNSFVAESDDLLQWKNFSLAMGFGPPGEFDHGGCVVGAYLYESYEIRAPRILKRHKGTFWTLYGAYPRQGGYELRPGYEGVAISDDGRSWGRAKPSYIPANGPIEQLGLATSGDLLNWTRYKGNPVLRNRPGGYDERFCSDGKVFWDGDHWTMFYFGVGRGGAHIMIAFSRDLLHWTAHPEPLYKAGGHAGGLDRQYAHKISLVYRPQNDTFYMHYCATGDKGRCIGLLTSKPLN